MFSFLLVFQLALAVTNPLPLFAYVDTLTGGDTCESLTYSPHTPRLPPATLPRHASPGTGNTYPLTQEPLSYYLLQGFSLLLACGKVFNIWRELPVARCQLRAASCESRCQRTARHIHFNFHFPSTAAQREFLYFFVEVFFLRSQRFTNLFPAQATTTTATRTTTRVTAVS